MEFAGQGCRRQWEPALEPALLPALCGTEALFGMSTQSNKTGVGQSKSEQEALGQSKITQGSCAWCRNPEDPQAHGKTELSGQQQHGKEDWRGHGEWSWALLFKLESRGTG